MALELDLQRERRGLMRPLLDLVGINGGVIVEKAKFEGNMMDVQVRGREYVERWTEKDYRGLVSLHSGIPGVVSSSKLQVVYVGEEKRRVGYDSPKKLYLTQGKVTVGIPGGGNYKFKFLVHSGFHYTVDKLFAKKEQKWEHGLEQVGLAAPEQLDVSLAYSTPIGIWRYLPGEFIKGIKGFMFSGPVYKIGWPRGGFGKDFLGVDVVGKSGQDGEAAFCHVKDRLCRLGFIYQESKGIRTPDRRDFLIDGELDFDVIAQLEDVVNSNFPDKRNTQIPIAEVLVEGKFGRNSFSGMERFENFMNARSMGGSMQVRGGKIVVERNYGQGTNVPPTAVSIEGTLEDAERLYSTEIFPGRISVQIDENIGELVLLKE